MIVAIVPSISTAKSIPALLSDKDDLFLTMPCCQRKVNKEPSFVQGFSGLKQAFVIGYSYSHSSGDYSFSMGISCGRTVNKLWKTIGNYREFDSVGEFQNQARFERGFAVFRACKPNSPTLSNSRYLGEMFSPSIMGVFQYYV